MRIQLLPSAIVAALTAATLFCPAAHADPEGDYLDILGNTPGVIGGPINNAIYTAAGHRACDILHNGGTSEDAVTQLTVPLYVQPWLARSMVGAAQTAMCPDTKP